MAAKPITKPTEEVTLAQAIDAFLTAAADRVRPATRAQYASVLKTHAVPNRGHIPLRRLTVEHVRTLYDDLRKLASETGVSVRTLQALHTALRQSLEYAVEREWLTANPMAGLRRPGGSKQAKVKDSTSVRYWSTQELKRLLAAAHEVLTPQQALVFETLASTGCRISEALGLTFRDHAEPRLAFVRTFSKARQIEAMKSETSRRTIEVPTHLSQLIDQERTRRRAGVDDFIFATQTGVPIDQDRVRKLLGKVLRFADVPTRTIHEIRHSHAVALLERGISLKVVQLRLGQADPAVTLRTYSHVTTALEGGAVRALEDALG